MRDGWHSRDLTAVFSLPSTRQRGKNGLRVTQSRPRFTQIPSVERFLPVVLRSARPTKRSDPRSCWRTAFLEGALKRRLRSLHLLALSRVNGARDQACAQRPVYRGGGVESATKRRQSQRISEATRVNQRKRRVIVRTASSQFAASNP